MNTVIFFLVFLMLLIILSTILLYWVTEYITVNPVPSRKTQKYKNLRDEIKKIKKLLEQSTEKPIVKSQKPVTSKKSTTILRLKDKEADAIKQKLLSGKKS